MSRKASEIRADIAAIHATAAEMQETIHNLAVECALHAFEHGDGTLAAELVEQMPTGQRTASLRAWFTKYTGIKWTFKDGEIVAKVDMDPDVWSIDEGKETPYYTKPETVTKELTLAQLQRTLRGLQGRVEKALNGEGNVTIKEGEDVAAIKKLARQASIIAGGDVSVAA